jgi:hypothetical protein
MQHTAILSGLAAALLGLAAQAASAADGLRAPDAASVWPSWQTRLSLTLAEPAWSGARVVRRAALLGDYYLNAPDADPSARWRGGFRATSGVVLGGLGPHAWPAGSTFALSATTIDDAGGAPDGGFWPYVGLGYTGLAPRGGWGFSADVGLALRQPGLSVDGGRASAGLPGWEGTLRRFDLMPMVQLGVRYSF